MCRGKTKKENTMFKKAILLLVCLAAFAFAQVDSLAAPDSFLWKPGTDTYYPGYVWWSGKAHPMADLCADSVAYPYAHERLFDCSTVKTVVRPKDTLMADVHLGKNDLAYVDSVIAGHPTMWWDPAALIDTLAYAYITMEFGEHKADLSKWGGICFEYTADMDFDFKVKANAIVEIYDSPAEFNPTFTVKVPKSDSPNIVSIKWDEIYGKNNPEYFDAAFSSIADFKIVFKGDGVFKMTQFGSLGQCVKEEKTEIVAHRTHTAPSLSISGRKLHLDGIDNGKVAIFTATGKAVLSGRATGTIDLSSLQSGVYMVKVVAPNYNRAERIVIR